MLCSAYVLVKWLKVVWFVDRKLHCSWELGAREVDIMGYVPLKGVMNYYAMICTCQELSKRNELNRI